MSCLIELNEFPKGFDTNP